jgi:hypothetical protein
MAYTNIDDPSAYFQATTYTGAGANTVVTNGGNSDLQPDFLWIKNRTAGYAHFVVDSSRNISYAQNSSNAPYLETDSTAAENNNQNWMQSVNTDGFTTGISEHTNCNSGSAYVAWQWKVNGGTTTSLSNTGPDSVVQVNSDAKFSIGTYTGNGSNSNVKHGLGETPDMLIVKRRTGGTGSWAVWHKDLTSSYWLRLDTTVAQASGVWDGLDPQSEKFFITGGSSNVNISGADYVFYAWKGVQGYSKFGKYVGNGDSSKNGPFVYLGFKPAFVMIKPATQVEEWAIIDTARNPINQAMKQLKGNSSGAEYNGASVTNGIDILSNGFKVRTSRTEINTINATYIYMAFAENPFVTSTGTPTTAR